MCFKRAVSQEILSQGPEISTINRDALTFNLSDTRETIDAVLPNTSVSTLDVRRTLKYDVAFARNREGSSTFPRVRVRRMHRTYTRLVLARR